MIYKQINPVSTLLLTTKTYNASSASAPSSTTPAFPANKVASCYSASKAVKQKLPSFLMNGNASPQTDKKSSSKRKAKTPS